MNKPRKRKLVWGSAKWCEQKATENAVSEIFRNSFRNAVLKAYGEEEGKWMLGEKE